MFKLKRTNSEDPDFRELVQALDKELAERNGETNAFFAQFNKTHHIKNVVIAYLQGEAVGCGAMKKHSTQAIEIKRMYVRHHMRGKGVAGLVLHELQGWAREYGYRQCMLETGLKMPEAIALYQKHHFKQIPNYGPYAGVEDSICFAIDL